MKVSLKVREDQRPILRAKLPLNVLGLPVSTGITSGDQRELALHLGTDVQALPSFRLSYKPNNVSSPFSVLVKTGFGLWGSPNGAALAMSAEFNLNSSGSPSFSVRLKPRIGDFGLRKDSGRFRALYEKVDIVSGSGEEIATGSAEQIKSVDANAESNVREAGSPTIYSSSKSSAAPSRQGIATANGDHHGKNLIGLGTGSGAFVMEKVESFSNGTLEKSDSFEKPKELTEKVKISEHGPHDENVHEEQVAESTGDVSVGALGGLRKIYTSGPGKSWFRGSAKGWKFNAFSSLPLGEWAVARVRWQVNFGSNLFYDLRHGFHVTDIRLPALTVDKVSFEALNPRKSRGPSTDLAFLGFGYSDEESSQLGRIATMCASMRYQLQLLHLENKLIKTTMDEWRGDLAVRRPAGKGTELLMQEETALRSQMFDELNGKMNGTGKTREGRQKKDSFSMGDSQAAPRPSSGKVGTSTGEDFATNVDATEELQKALMNAAGGGYGA